MKLIKFFSLLLLVMAAGIVRAQSPVIAVVSEIKAYAVAPTMGQLEVRIAGRDAETVLGAYVTISGPCIPGGSYVGYVGGSRVSGGSPRVILSGTFPVIAPIEDKSVLLEVNVSIAGMAEEPGDGRVFYHWSSVVSTSNP